MFRNFSLTKDSLASKEALEQLLQKQMDEGNLPSKRYTVYDLQAWREKAHEFYSQARTIEAKYYSAFEYYVVGKIISTYSIWKSKRENTLRKRSREAATK
jgi:hypothetical protein